MLLTRTRDDRTAAAWTARVPVAYAAFVVVALAAWALLGDRWWTQPLNLTTFWWSLPGVVLAPVALLVGRRRAALLFAVPALVWVWSYGTLFLPNLSADDGPADLRVVSFNTLVAVNGVGHVLDLVDAEQPDVVLLQELFPERLDALVDGLADSHPHVASVVTEEIGGVAVFSRHPIVERLPVAMASGASRDTEVVVLDVDGQLVQVVPVHLTSPCLECGSSVADRLTDEASRRTDELTTVLHTLRRGVPAIVGGDFNSTDRSDPYRLLTSAGFEDPHRLAGFGPGFTWPADRGPFPVLRIDWVLTRGLGAVASHVGDGGDSDHLPVIIDLAFLDEEN